VAKPKLRVYELAREFNTTNTALIEKLIAMGIPAKSHMTTIDIEMIPKIKASIFGDKQALVEERVKGTVIRRRRKKTVKPEESSLEVLPESDSSTTLLPLGKSETLEQPDNNSDNGEAPPLMKEGLATKQVFQQENEEKEEPGRKETEKKMEHDAHKENAEKEEVKKKDGEVDRLIAKEKVDVDQMTVQKKTEEKLPKKKKPSATDKVPRHKRGKKKIVKDAPAKIIKLPDPVAKVEKKSAGSPSKSASGPGFKRGEKKGEKQFKPNENISAKKKVNKPEKFEKDSRLKDVKKDAKKDINWSKKKITFKKKEVIEGNALYSKGKKGRKRKKPFKGKKVVNGQKTLITTPKAIKRRIKIDETITLSDLARRMGIKANEMIAKLMDMGVMATVNQTIDFDTASIVAAEFKYELEKASFEEEIILNTEEIDSVNMLPRPPVVTIMGHVDHGKTSLLDMIRKTKARITDTEAGGITQHIGAYSVETGKGRIAFLDTPGHEAFTAMRSRGAGLTDMVILVVAADDGVMPQTLEAISHAKAANVPIIVAVNKIDKPGADPERVKRELAEAGLAPDDWGGESVFVNVSAKVGTGIDDLLEILLLQAEMRDLKADPDRLARGYIVESRLDPGRGPVATVLIQQGTLHAGEPVVCGIRFGKIRSLMNDLGGVIDVAGPSLPVEITGLAGVPNCGDELIAVVDEKSAKQVSAHRAQKQRAKELAKTSKMSLEKLYEKLSKGTVVDLNLIIKADVHGSIEAIADSVLKLSNENVKINIIHSATGTVTESDVSLAVVSEAIILGFNVRPDAKVRAIAAEEHVDMRFYNIIYDLIANIENAIIGLMPSTFKEHLLGTAEIREVFHIPKIGSIAGAYITEGKIERSRTVRLLREGIVIYEGKISSLRRFKDDVKEVLTGFECGIGIENYNDIKTGDFIECFYMEEIKAQAV